MKNLIRRLAIRKLKASGFSSYAAASFFEDWWEDFFREKRTSLAQKLWAYRRGFLSSRIPCYGLTEDNYRDYLSDFDYMRLHPINGPYSKWIDDKLTIRYMLAPYSEYLPEYFFHIYRSEVLPLMDLPAGFGSAIPDVLRLLQSRGALAVKLKAGTSGQGFTKLAYIGSVYSINNEPCAEEHVHGFLDGLLKGRGAEYIITEYIQGHADLCKIWPEAPSAVRIVTARQSNQAPRLIYASILIPNRKARLTTNLTRYSVACLIDIDTGRMYNGAVLVDGVLVPCSHHPDSHVLLEGVLPNWPLIHDKILEICSYIPQVRYMGFDLIVTDDGFKIIEINSHHGLSLMQSYFPALKNEPSQGFFTRLLEEKRDILKRK